MHVSCVYERVPYERKHIQGNGVCSPTPLYDVVGDTGPIAMRYGCEGLFFVCVRRFFFMRHTHSST